MALHKIEDATRAAIPLLIGLMGSTGSGKSLSALRLAYGMQQAAGPGAGPIAMLEAGENGRSAIYAPAPGQAPDPVNARGQGYTFAFKRLVLPPPYNPLRYKEALEQLRGQCPAVVVVDQMTAEWRGRGGMLEMVDEAEVRNQLAKWKRPRDEHWAFMGVLETMGCPVLCCYRAEERVELKGSEVVQAGWKPIAETLLPYQMTFSFLIGHNKPGQMSLDRKLCRYVKSYEGAVGLIQEGELATEAVGKRLAAWAAGTEPASSAQPS